MKCTKKDKVLLYYFSEVNANEMAEFRAHLDNCAECQIYLGEIKQTMCKLEKLEEIPPPPYILYRVLNSTASSIQQQIQPKTLSNSISTILQIALGQIFLFAIIYILNSSIVVSKFWDTVKNLWPINLIGSYGFSFFIILGIGSLLTLAAAPIVLLDSKNKKSLSLK